MLAGKTRLHHQGCPAGQPPEIAIPVLQPHRLRREKDGFAVSAYHPIPIDCLQCFCSFAVRRIAGSEQFLNFQGTALELLAV